MAEILVDFKVDQTQLLSALDTLEQTGQIEKGMADSIRKTNAELNKQAQGMDKVGKAAKGPITSLDQLDKRTKKFITDFTTNIQQGFTEELAKANMQIKALGDQLEKTGKTGGKATNSLRQELKNLTQDIAAAKASGGPIDQKMIQRAGQLKDAIADANAEIKSAGSDTESLDNLVGSVSALASGFAAVQGAVGLFADENEDLQKALLKVNSAMALAQGIQQVANALQKEGAISLAILNAQQKIQVIQTNLAAAAESKNIVVRYAAAAAQKALNLAMAANPIGLLLTLLAAVAVALYTYTQNSNEAARSTNQYKASVELLNEELERRSTIVERNSRREIIDLKRAGAEQSKIIKAEIDGLNNVIATREEAEKKAREVIEANRKLGIENKDNLAAQAEAEKALEKSRQETANLRIGVQEKQLELDKQVAAESKAASDAKEAADEKALAAQKAGIQDLIAIKKTEQLLYDESSTRYRKLEADIIRLQGKYEALGASSAQAAFAIADASKKADAVDMSTKVNTGLRSIEKQSIDTSKAIQKVAGDVTVTVTGVAETAGKSLQDQLKEFQSALGEISTIGRSLYEISRGNSEAIQQEIDLKRKQVDELLKAGAITEKEAEARQKRIDRQTAQLQYKAAVREKQLAIFNGLINVAQAVTKAFTAGPIVGQILAGVVAALGAAQVAAIASRPVPRMATGKKGTYRGPAVVGDAGAELIEQGGRMWVAEKPTTVWLNQQDKVYTASETRRMLPTVNRNAMRAQKTAGNSFDYDKMAQAMGKSGNVNINIDKGFITEAVRDGLTTTNYHNTRYRK